MSVQSKVRRGAAAAVMAGALLAPAAASAHVTVQPTEIPAGGFARMDVRVPNEEDNANTTKVQVQVPPGFFSLRYEPTPGWSVDVQTEKLNPPVKDGNGEERTEQVKEVVFTADKGNKGIEPGQFMDFGLSGGPVPGKAGASISFPSVQTYSNGEVVRWIEKSPDAEHPAPQVKLTANPEEGGAAPATTATPTAAKSDDDGDFASKGLGIAALIVGALGLLVGIAAFAASRRKPAA